MCTYQIALEEAMCYFLQPTMCPHWHLSHTSQARIKRFELFACVEPFPLVKDPGLFFFYIEEVVEAIFSLHWLLRRMGGVEKNRYSVRVPFCVRVLFVSKNAAALRK